VSLSEANGDWHAHAFALFQLGRILSAADPPAALAALDAADRIAAANGAEYIQHMSRACTSWAWAELRDLRRSIRIADEAIVGLRSIGDGWFFSGVLTFSAYLKAAAGDHVGCDEALARGHRLVERSRTVPQQRRRARPRARRIRRLSLGRCLSLVGLGRRRRPRLVGAARSRQHPERPAHAATPAGVTFAPSTRRTGGCRGCASRRRRVRRGRARSVVPRRRSRPVLHADPGDPRAPIDGGGGVGPQRARPGNSLLRGSGSGDGSDWDVAICAPASSSRTSTAHVRLSAPNAQPRSNRLGSP